MMNTKSIDDYLRKRCGSIFKGVFSCDTLPKRVRGPALFVCNTDPEDHPGHHWISIYVSEHREGEFMDSFGRAPGSPFKEFMEKHCETWMYNHKQLQNIYSHFCGHYCIFYCLYRSKNLDMRRIVEMFTNDTVNNDNLVHGFVCY